MPLLPGTPRFIAAMVAAQVLTQIGAFTLPALLPVYIGRWSLSGTEAGWLIGIFFAAYVPAVPLLLALTDRVPARRIYLVGPLLTGVVLDLAGGDGAMAWGLAFGQVAFITLAGFAVLRRLGRAA